MTLIAALTPDDVPFLIGDLLLTGESSVDVGLYELSGEIVTPLHGVRPNIPCPYQGTRVVSMTQKLVVLSPGLAVGWSGQLDAARRLLSNAAMRLADPLTAPDPIARWLEDQDYDDLRQCGLIFVCLHGNGRWSVSSSGDGPDHSALTQSHKVFGNIRAYGSGCATLDHHLKDLDPGHALDVCNVGADTILPSLARAFSLTASLAGNEFLGDPAVRLSFGGFYELVYADPVFTKLTDITYVFWTVEADLKAISLLPFVIKVEYSDDIMVIRRANLRYESDASELDSYYGNMYWIVNQPHREPISKDFPIDCVRDLNSTHYVHYVIPADYATMGVCVLAGLFHCDRFVRFQESGQTVNIKVHSSLTAELLSAVRRRVAIAPVQRA